MEGRGTRRSAGAKGSLDGSRGFFRCACEFGHTRAARRGQDGKGKRESEAKMTMETKMRKGRHCSNA
jgi:hypothetical protein